MQIGPNEEAGSDDFVRVATCHTPTEAHLLSGVLQSAGLTPRVADAHFLQAHGWMTTAAGGVRVLVPASQVEEAHKAIASFHAGAFELEGEASTAPSFQVQPSPAFNADRAVLLSFVLTPVFGAAIHLANASALGPSRRRLGLWIWLFVLASVSAAVIVVVHRWNPGPLAAFRGSWLLSLVTVVWYFIAGQQQSRALIAAYGVNYRKRGLAMPALVAGAALLALGWTLDTLA